MPGEAIGGDRRSGVDAYNFPAYYRDINLPARIAYRRTSPLHVGDEAPRFSLAQVGGGTFDLGKLLADGKHVVLVFGSYSAPPCVMEMPAIDELGARAADNVVFGFVYTREVHPGELLPPHASMEQKMAHAQRFRDELGIRMAIGVDDLDGATHLAYGGLPFMAAIVHADGFVVYRSEWAMAADIERYLANLAERDAARAEGVYGQVSYTEAQIYRRRDEDRFVQLLSIAGAQAVEDQAGAHREPRVH